MSEPKTNHRAAFYYAQAFYTITIMLQAICVIHCVRSGTQQNLIYLIIFYR
ncbi:MAG: hypothetical protein IPG86_06755 [Chitinophagaceae bacterium]|nr:hypothetical protein [Chitinophagaceae bacterium]